MKSTGAAIVALSAVLDRIGLFLAKAALVGMVGVIMLQVVSRYGLRQPPTWTEELARYLMVWGGLLGAASAFRRATDPVVVKVDELAGDRRARFARLAIAATVVIFIGPILYFSIFGAGMDPARGFLVRMSARSSPALGINMVFIASAIPTVCTLLLVHLAARLVAGPLPVSHGETR